VNYNIDSVISSACIGKTACVCFQVNSAFDWVDEIVAAVKTIVFVCAQVNELMVCTHVNVFTTKIGLAECIKISTADVHVQMKELCNLMYFHNMLCFVRTPNIHWIT
jgi:hypothetical protein